MTNPTAVLMIQLKTIDLPNIKTEENKSWLILYDAIGFFGRKSKDIQNQLQNQIDQSKLAAKQKFVEKQIKLSEELHAIKNKFPSDEHNLSPSKIKIKN